MRQRTFVFFLGIFLSFWIGALGESDARTSTSHRLEGALAQLLDLDGAKAKVWAQEHGILLDSSAQSVRVVIELKQSRLLDRDALQALGGVVTAESERLLRAFLPLRHLREIAQLPGIAFIRRPYTMRPLGIPYATGTLPTGALLFHSYGFRGQGVKVAVIDAGFQGLGEAILKGWISPSAIYDRIDYTGEGFEGKTDHGTQVTRIAYEMAPEASLILMKISDEVDLENAVEDAIRLGVRIINHSIGWFDSNFGDGRGLIDEIAQEVRDAGILWVNAAGNQAQQHWLGLFRDDNKNGWAEFELEREALTVWAGLGGVIELVLVWDDWPYTDQDYDLFLLNGWGETVASSESSQWRGEPPRESLEYLAEEPGVYQLKVKARRATRPMRLKIFSITSGQTLTPNTPHGSVVAPADCECALAVGATGVRQWDEGIVEYFSALGPTSDGRIKPDLIGPDGAREFFGTSAAAPHVAGAAALLLSQHPDWEVSELWGALEGDAVDLGPPGRDVTSGSGRLQLLLGRPQAIRSLSAASVAVGGSVTVRISVRMPAVLFGDLTLREQLPPGLSLESLEDAKAQITKREGANEAQWSWPLLGPGETREVVYRLSVADTVKPGRYRLTGNLNGQPIEGEEWLEVLPRISVATQVTKKAILFRVTGSPIQGFQVQIFDLSGRERVHSDWVYKSKLAIDLGRDWANGVYLYVMIVRGSNGQLLTREVKRLVVLR